MEEYKKSDIWEYIELVSQGKSEATIKRNEIIKKYESAGVENPIYFEIEKLADVISQQKGYKNSMDFINNHSKKMQNAFYVTGLDSSLIRRD